MGHKRDGRLLVQRVSRRTIVLEKGESTHGKRVRLMPCKVFVKNSLYQYYACSVSSYGRLRMRLQWCQRLWRWRQEDQRTRTQEDTRKGRGAAAQYRRPDDVRLQPKYCNNKNTYTVKIVRCIDSMNLYRRILCVTRFHLGWSLIVNKSTMKGGREDVDTPFWSWDAGLSGACWPKWPGESLSPRKITFFEEKKRFFEGVHF